MLKLKDFNGENIGIDADLNKAFYDIAILIDHIINQKQMTHSGRSDNAAEPNGIELVTSTVSPNIYEVITVHGLRLWQSGSVISICVSANVHP